ncbi:PilZ domain-containing protein [Pontibacter sp. JAM-7]|uniref:PilZ domain-containing protein n=1 Tax=Pontibacter sp. JAM-7 TaxID=3366581 RepID=UPI003AF799FF
MGIERRIDQRIGSEIPAEAECAFGPSPYVTITNISRDGLQLEGNGQLVEMRPAVHGTPLELTVHFGLSGQPVHFHCRAMYRQALDNDRSRLGLRILSADPVSSARLQDFVSDHRFI